MVQPGAGCQVQPQTTIDRRASEPVLWRTSLWLCAAVALQIVLGAFTIWTIKHPYVTSAHVVTGAAILGLSTLLALRAWPLTTGVPRPEEAKSPARGLKTATS